MIYVLALAGNEVMVGSFAYWNRDADRIISNLIKVPGLNSSRFFLLSQIKTCLCRNPAKHQSGQLIPTVRRRPSPRDLAPTSKQNLQRSSEVVVAVRHSGNIDSSTTLDIVLLARLVRGPTSTLSGTSSAEMPTMVQCGKELDTSLKLSQLPLTQTRA
jgi:hypothetical protein